MSLTRPLPALLGEALTSVALEILEGEVQKSVAFAVGRTWVGYRVDAVRTLACQYTHAFRERTSEPSLRCTQGTITASTVWPLGEFYHLVFVLEPDAPYVFYLNSASSAPLKHGVLCLFIHFVT